MKLAPSFSPRNEPGACLGRRVLFTSDSGYATEQWLLENEPDLRADILVKGQHGKDLSGTPGFLLLLGLVGVGLGLFTSPNNATVMGSVPAGQAGMASGILNMSRGLGTALGLSMTGLLFAVNGGASGSPARADHAFTITALALAAVAAAAGVAAGGAPGSDEVNRPRTRRRTAASSTSPSRVSW